MVQHIKPTTAGDAPSSGEFRAVDEAIEAISGSLDLNLLLERTLVCLMKTFECNAAAFQLRDVATGVLRVQGAVGLTTEKIEALCHAARGRWPGDRAVATGKPVVVDEVDDEDWTEQLEVDGQRLRALLGIPVAAGENLLGALTLGSPVPGWFAKVGEPLVTRIARHLAVAVQNAQLYGHAQRGRIEWERTFDAIGDPIAVFDSEGRIVRANAALASINGWPVNAVVGRTCYEVGFCGEVPDCAVKRALRLRRPSREEVRRPDGQVFVTTTVPIEGGGGRVSVVQVAKNVTEETQNARQLRAMSEELAAANTRLTGTLDQLKAAQAQVVQSEKLVAIGQLVAGVAHELNNPLTSVIGYAQLLEDELVAASSNGSASVTAPEDVLSDVRRIGDEAERAAKIVRNLLAFARRQSGERTLLHVPDLVVGVLSLRAYELDVSSIAVDLSFEPNLPNIYGDSNQLQQALLNLILNAEQAMKGNPAGGHLGISACFERDAQAVLIKVSDDGHGIDTLHVPRVFDPFFTTRPVGAGTGLGLSISYGIIRDHGGHISVDSSPGSGATFSVLLPARFVERAGPHLTPRLILAHGESNAREFLAAVFTAWGYDVTAVSTTRGALERLGRMSADIVLVDRSICEGHLAQWQDALPGVASEVLFVFTSIKEESDEIGRLARAYGRAFVDPPFQLGALRAALRVIAKECV